MTRRDGIDSGAVFAEVFGKDMGHLLDGALGRGLEVVVWSGR